jgi:D-sedoheptulose 7-phosphate isomerase
MKRINEIIEESIACKRKFIDQTGNIKQAAEKITASLKAGGKLLVFGNGGSAADAQHMAAELVGRYMLERKGYPAIALTTDTSILTAVGNDYGYASVFERQVEALAKKRDVLIGLSTSGNSENVVRALEKGRAMGTVNISLTGKDGGRIKAISDVSINAPSEKTARIQECHGLAIHILCELVEQEMTQ